VVTGAADKAFKRPESVLVLVHTRIGEVLLLRRRKPRWFWQSVTGSLRWDESPRLAAERELLEETGLRAEGRLVDCGRTVSFPIIPPWKARYAPNAHLNREHWFRLEIPSRRMVCLRPAEHREYRWLPALEAARRASSWTNRKAIVEELLAGYR